MGQTEAKVEFKSDETNIVRKFSKMKNNYEKPRVSGSISDLENYTC